MDCVYLSRVRSMD